MKVLHPNYTEYKDLTELNDFFEDGIYNIIDENKVYDLNNYLTSFKAFRSEKKLRIMDVDLYENLPFSINTPTWLARQKDTEIVDLILNNKSDLNILDLGAWNCWLSNYIAQKGHIVTAVDLFTDEFDGLKAINNYKTKITAVQLYPDEIFRFKGKFDLIIFNRNWSFITKPENVLKDALNLLSENGTLLFTGLAFYKNSTEIEAHLKKLDKQFKKAFNMSLFFKKSKGYLDDNDYTFFKENNIELKSYNKIKNALKFFFPKKGKVYYGIKKINEY